MRDAIRTTLADMAGFLNRERVPFALIGGIAVMVHGEARFTADVDAVAAVEVARALALVETLDDSAFDPFFRDVGELVKASFILPLRHKKTNIKIDLAVGVTGFEKQLVSRARDTDLAGIILPVATSEDLILLKLIASRDRDIADVNRIVARQGENLDWDYLIATRRDLQDAISQDIVKHLNELRRS